MIMATASVCWSPVSGLDLSEQAATIKGVKVLIMNNSVEEKVVEDLLGEV